MVLSSFLFIGLILFFCPTRILATGVLHLETLGDHKWATCGTPELMAAHANRDLLPEKTRRGLALFQTRPSTQSQYTSPSGRFRIHYDTNGTHAVEQTDLTGNGVPDYVDAVAATADSTWSFQVDQLGYQSPRTDNTAGGGRDEVDIYIREFGSRGFYGIAYPVNNTGLIASGYLEIDNNYTDDIYPSQGLAGLGVTIAHEFFHVIQFGYYSSFDAAWWQESTATWMEDIAYPEVNDYYQYLPDFFIDPTISLDRFRFRDRHPFGSTVFIHNLNSVFGPSVIRTSWEQLGVQKNWSLGLIDEVLTGGFDQVLPRFATWNYFTETRSLPGYYPEASAYPLIQVQDISLRFGQSTTTSGQMDHLAADYIRFVPPSFEPGGLSVNLTLDTRAKWKAFALLVGSGGFEIMEETGREFRIPMWNQYKEIVIIPVCLTQTGSGYTYQARAEVRGDILKPASAIGDFIRNGIVDFDDFFLFVNGFGKTAADSGFDVIFDLNGDGAIDLDDFFIFADHFGESTT